MTFLFQGQI